MLHRIVLTRIVVVMEVFSVVEDASEQALQGTPEPELPSPTKSKEHSQETAGENHNVGHAWFLIRETGKTTALRSTKNRRAV